MGELYNCFKTCRSQYQKDWFMDKIGLVKFECNGKKHEIFFTRKRANRYTIIHCKNNTVEWEQFPMLPKIAGNMHGKRDPMISIGLSKDCIRLFIIMGKPNSITGLDDGIFRSIHKFDEKFINVMSEARFKEI